MESFAVVATVVASASAARTAALKARSVGIEPAAAGFSAAATVHVAVCRNEFRNAVIEIVVKVVRLAHVTEGFRRGGAVSAFANVAVAVIVVFSLTAALFRFGTEFFDDAEVRLTAQRVHPQKAHKHLVAAPERAPALLAEGKTLVRVEHVEVIARDVAEAHEPFGNRVGDGNVDAPFFNTRDGRFEVVTDAAFQNPAATHLDGDAFDFLVLDFVRRN